MIFRSILLSIFSIVLSACAGMSENKNIYTQPVTADGPMCVTACQTIKLQCQANAAMNARNTANICVKNAKADYERCLLNANTDVTKSSCQLRMCSDKDFIGQCTNTFDSCFKSCGGSISAP